MGKKRNIIVLVVIVIAFPILVNILAAIYTPWTQGHTDVWIGFFGSYAGALIGGFIAYFSAKIQIDAMKRQEHDKRLIRQIPSLILLKYEVEKAKLEIEGIMKIPDKIKDPSGDEIDIVKVPIRMQAINKDNWCKLEQIDDVDFMKQIVEFREDYFRMHDILSKDYNQIQSIINDLRSRLNKKQDRIRSQNITAAIIQLTFEAQDIEQNKPIELNKIKNDTYLNRANKLIDRIEEKIRSINNLKIHIEE